MTRGVRSFISGCGMLVAATTLMSAQVPADLREAIDARRKAIDGADVQGFDHLTTDDFTQVDGTGKMSTKADRLAAISQQTVRLSPLPVEELLVSVHGDAAVRRFRTTNVVIEVWVKDQGQWRVAATQITPLAR